MAEVVSKILKWTSLSECINKLLWHDGELVLNPCIQMLDNKCRKRIKQYTINKDIIFQLASQYWHFHNVAER